MTLRIGTFVGVIDQTVFGGTTPPPLLPQEHFTDLNTTIVDNADGTGLTLTVSAAPANSTGWYWTSDQMPGAINNLGGPIVGDHVLAALPLDVDHVITLYARGAGPEVGYAETHRPTQANTAPVEISGPNLRLVFEVLAADTPDPMGTILI